MTVEARLEDGTVLNFPDGTDPQIIQATVKRHLGAQTQQALDLSTGEPQPGFGENFTAGAEMLLSVGSAALAEPIAGLAGLASLPFSGSEGATENIRATQEALTFQPRTETGQAFARNAGEFLEPALKAVEGGSE